MVNNEFWFRLDFDIEPVDKKWTRGIAVADAKVEELALAFEQTLKVGRVELIVHPEVSGVLARKPSQVL